MADIKQKNIKHTAEELDAVANLAIPKDGVTPLTTEQIGSMKQGLGVTNLEHQVSEQGGKLDELEGDVNDIKGIDEKTISLTDLPSFTKSKGALGSAGNWSNINDSYKHIAIPVIGGVSTVNMTIDASSQYALYYCYVTDYEVPTSTKQSYNACNERQYLGKGQSISALKAPENAKYLVLNTTWGDKEVSFADFSVLVAPKQDGELTLLKEKIALLDSKTTGGLFSLNDLSKDGVFTSSFSFRVPKSVLSNSNMLVSACAKYTGDHPSIQFTYRDNNYNVIVYQSRAYTIGGNDVYKIRDWRVPPFPELCDYLDIDINVPDGTTLTINSISNKYSNAISRVAKGCYFNAHTGAWGLFNSLFAFEMSANMGFPRCIAVPKRTKDGVWVCFHDDNNLGKTLFDASGSPITTDEAKKISDYTYSELKNYYYKINRGTGIRQQVPTIEDFLGVCAKTGMEPMLSCHPIGDFADYWEELKNILSKYSLLKYTHIKITSDLGGLTIMYNTFGTDVASYTLDCSTASHIAIFDGLCDNPDTNPVDMTKVKMGIEFVGVSVIDDSKIQKALSNGWFVGIADNAALSGEEQESYIKKGVTEWTENTNMSFGLNW